MMAVMLDELEMLDQFILKIVLKSEEIKTYNILSYSIENDTLYFTLESDDWILYEENKYKTTFKIKYGNILDGLATKD